jgi:allantoate deiminase
VSNGPAVDATRVVADLRELDRRTGGPEGARRVAWGEEWREARALLGELLEELGIEGEPDEAGNVWARLEDAGEGTEGVGPGDGDSPRADENSAERGISSAYRTKSLALGSHLDSVPNGGWLDGALGVMAAVGVLRAWAAHDTPPPRPLALVDWADEEGARFGRSLLGSSAFSGTLDTAPLRDLVDAEGHTAAEVLADNGVDLDQMTAAASRQAALGAYLELHIEQGPVLEAAGLPIAAVAGCAGVERHRFSFSGQASHAGTTPMDARRDAGLAAAETALAIERIARERDAVGTTGGLELRPGIATAVAGEADLLVDLRHADATALAEMLAAARQEAEGAAAARGCALDTREIWRIEPLPFDADLVERATDVSRDAGGATEPMTSGALHDAAEIGRVVPAAMLFCPSKAGLSHAAGEDTDEADLRVAIEAFGRLADRVLTSG